MNYAATFPAPLPALCCSLAIAASALAPTPAATAAPTTADARIEATVSGVSGAEGLVGCALFASPVGFPLETARHAAATVRVAAQGGVATCVFEGLVPGDYAIAVVHDTNGNERADTNFLGMPTEGVGVSNDALPKMSAPDFDACRFAVAAGGTTTLSIPMRY